MPIEIRSVPTYFQQILRRIENVLDADVSIESFDDEWLNFYVDGYDPQPALRKLESSRRSVMTGPDAHNFRLLCPWDPSVDEGLWLHSLRHAEAPSDYLFGNWYY